MAVNVLKLPREKNGKVRKGKSVPSIPWRQTGCRRSSIKYQTRH